MEGRYLNRFRSLGDKTATQIKNRDAAGNLTEHITHARASISAQHENVRDLFATARELVTGINTTQQMMGIELVKNIPLPSEAIISSPSQQLGYIQLTLRFFQAGVLHFMEEMSNARDRIDELEASIGKLAQYDEEIDIIGKMVTLDLDMLEQKTEVAPPSPPESVKSVKMITPDDEKPILTSPTPGRQTPVAAPASKKSISTSGKVRRS